MDGLGSFNVAPTGGQVLYAPHPDATTVPEYTSQAMPAPVSYAPTADTSTSNTPPPTQPVPHPPGFQQVLAEVEQQKGRQLTKDEYDALYGEYRTRIAVPTLSRQKGAKKASVDAELASFDDRANKLRQQRYANQPDQNNNSSGVGNFAKAAGAEFFGSLVPGTAAFASRLAGGVTSLGGQAPNAVSDWFLRQSDPNIQADGKSDQQAGEDYAKMILGSRYNDPASADLRQKLVQYGAGNHNANAQRGIGGTSVGGFERELNDYANSKSQLGATAGDIGSLLTLFLGNDAALSKLGVLDKLGNDASKVDKLIHFLPTASTVAAKTSNEAATRNVERGDNISDVMRQEAVDQVLGTLFNLLPAHLPGGKLIRAITGGGAGAGEYLAQQKIDQQLNNKNEGPTLQGLETSAGFQAALAALLGGRGAAGLRGRKAPEAAPSAAEAAPAPEPAAAATDQAKPAGTPVDGYKLMLDEAPEQGIEDKAFSKVQSDALQQANVRAKKYKTAIQNANTPERVVTSAWKMAQKFSGDNWGKLSADQRNQLIETLSTWIGRKSNVGAEDIATHLETLRNPTSEDLASTTEQTPPVTEQPLPSGIEGQQVPGTVAQEPAPAAEPVAAKPAPKPVYVDPTYQKLWNDLNNRLSTDPAIQNSSLYQRLLPAVKSGKIDSAEKLQEVILQAQELAASKNKLKSKKPVIQASTEPVETPAVSTDTNAAHEAVAKTVSDALSEESTPETQRNKLKKAVRDKSEKKYNQAYLHALINRDNTAGSPEETAIRQDGAFNAAAEALRQGKITNADELGLFLKEHSGIATIGDQSNAISDATKKQQIGALLSSRNTKNNTVAAKRYVRESVLDPLIKLGEKESDIRKMTVEQAENHLQRLADTFTSMESAPVKGKRNTGNVLKLKKTNVEPVENPDETPPPKPKGKLGKLQKQLGASDKNKLKSALKGSGAADMKALADKLEGGKKPPKSEAPATVAGAPGTRIRDIKRNPAKSLREAQIKQSANTLVKDLEGYGVDRITAENMTRKDAAKLRSQLNVADALGEPLEPIIRKLGSKNNTELLGDELTSRFGDKITGDELNNLHALVVEARESGDKTPLNESLEDLVNTGWIDKDDVAFVRKLAGNRTQPETVFRDIIRNNGSGESSASLEAQHRLADEKANNQTRLLIERNGQVRPLLGVDAVDTHARDGQIIVQKNIGKDEWTVLSHGKDLSDDLVKGKINAVKDKLDNFKEEDDVEHQGEHTLNMDEVFDHADLRDKVNAELETPKIDSHTPLNVTHKVGKLVDRVRDGADVREVGEELKNLHDQLKERNLARRLNAMKDRRRGPEWVKARIQREIADTEPGSRQRDALEFGQWLLDQNPHIADDLAISIKELKDMAGGFNPASRIIAISKSSAHIKTVVHELLHASEDLLPPEIQNKIHGEYLGRLFNKIKQQKDNPPAIEFLQTAVSNYLHPSQELQNHMYELLSRNKKDIPADDYYKYFSPSEYWAEEGSSILRRNYKADSWVAKARDWFSSFIQYIKSALGLDSNSEVIKGLNKIMASSGEAQSPGTLDKGSVSFRDIDEENPTEEDLGYEPAPDADEDPNLQTAPKYDKNPIKLQEVTTAQKAIETTARADYGLEKAMQLARSKGVEINEDNNVEDAAFAKNGYVSEYNNKDWYETAEPVDDWLTNNVHRFAKNKEELFDKLNKFFQNTHWLERVKTDWAIESPLSPEAEIDRAELMDQVKNNEIDPSKASKELYALAEKNSVYTWEEWAEKNNVPIKTLQEQLDILDKESGMNQKSMGELNMLLNAPRERTQQRLVAAGLVDKNDPYIKLYNWKWYVPLKGSAYGGTPDNNFDLIPARRLSLRRLNQQMQAMEGRKSYAERPFTRLFVDMSRAGERHANSHVLNALYNLVVDHGKELGAHIETFTGRPKDGYVNTKTDKYVNVLKAPAHGVIVNDGDTHYIINLPPDSQLLRGLIQMNNVERPSKLDRAVGKYTNILARLYTTVHPGWQTFSGFVRDLTYVPFTMAATRFDNPLAAVPFFAKYYVNVFQAYRALPTLLPHLLADNPKARHALGLKTVREMGEAKPDSWAGWTRRYEQAGGSNQFTKGFDVPGAERLFQEHLKDVDGLLDATKWTWRQVLEYTGNYANFLESISRVAGFKTLSEEGFSPHDAAVQVRKTLDYSQSGIKGRKINSWLAFFRVGMTGADAMRRAFTKKTGGFDYVKAAKWQGFFGALGAIGYMMGAALLGQDEDGKDKIAKLEPDTLTQKMVFPVGDKIAGVNLGLGMPQVMMAPGILAAAVSMGHMDKGKALEAYWKMLLRNGPVSPAGRSGSEPTDFAKAFIVGFTPTVARPIVDVGTNVNSFDSPIHARIEDNSKYHSDQGRSTTPKEFTEMATWLREVTDNKVDMYPEDIRYLVQNYGGQWATDFVKTALSDPNAQAGAGPEPNRLAGKLFVSDAKHYMDRELYDTLDNLNDSQRRYNSLVANAKQEGATDQQAKSQADVMVSRDPTFRKELTAYKALDTARRDYQAKIKTLRANRLISDTRKELERKRLDSTMRQAIEKAQAVLGQ